MTTSCTVPCAGITSSQLFSGDLAATGSDIAWPNNYCDDSCVTSSMGTITVKYKLGLGSDCYSDYSGTDITINENTGDITIQGNVETDSQYLVLRTETTEMGFAPAYQCSNQFKFQYLCGSSSTNLSPPTSDIVSPQTFPYYQTTDKPFSWFPPFESSNPGCPIIDYSASDKPAFDYSIEIASSWTSEVDVNTGNTIIKLIDESNQTILDANANIYNFQIRITAKGGKVLLYTNKTIRLKIDYLVCPNIITQTTTYPNTETDVQYVPLSSAQTFILP